MRQNDKVIAYCKENGSISPFEAFEHLRITRLAAVVFNLEREGYKFEHILIVTTNQLGEHVKYMRYILKSS